MVRAFVRLLLCATFIAATAADPTVQLPNGASVSGITTTASDGGRINTFRGIPYAEPPVGPNRWRQAKLKQPAGAINATAYGNVCLGDARYDPLYAQFTPSEDCLFLNVYTPAKASSTSKLPVMVWIYGGAFIGGSSNSYDGTNLAGKNVVVVTLNYRLGVFGFLSNDAILAQGDGANFALRDQETALKWVKAYIARFGGDPNNITAFGESAGAFSVALHMISRDGNQQLFHKGIMQSGAYPATHDTTSLGLMNENFKSLAASVGCANTTGSSTVECLRQVSTETIHSASGSLPWRPVVDGVFLRDVPTRRVLAGKISPVPTIVGVNTDEGYMFTTGIEDPAQLKAYLQGMYPLMTEAEYEQVAELYPVSQFPSAHHRMGEIFGDVTFVCPSESFSLALASRPFVPTYRYRFNRTVELGGFQLAQHTYEIAYVFNTTIFPFPGAEPTGAESQSVVSAMQNAWVNFATTANPNGYKSPVRTAWPQFNGITQRQLVLQPVTAEETMGSYMRDHKKRCAFWRTVDSRILSEVAFS